MISNFKVKLNKLRLRATPAAFVDAVGKIVKSCEQFLAIFPRV